MRTSLIYGPAADVPDSTSPDTGWHQWDWHTRWIVGDLRARKSVHLFPDELRCPIWMTALAQVLVELADHAHSGVRLARFPAVDRASTSLH